MRKNRQKDESMILIYKSGDLFLTRRSGTLRRAKFDEKTATDKFFTSTTFSKLADTSNGLYEKDWTEIYELLLSELKL